MHFNRSFQIFDRPTLGFFMRVLLLLIFLLLSIWETSLLSLSFSFIGCLMFRKICCRNLAGINFELRAALSLSLFIQLLSLPSGKFTGLDSFFTTFFRFFVFLSPSTTFALCLYPREAALAVSRFAPSAVILSLEVALRFMPLLAKEAVEVYSIQKARQAFSSGKMKTRLKAFLIPFFVRLFRISDRVAYSLHNRNIKLNSKRIIVPPDLIAERLRNCAKEKAQR